MQLLNNGNGWLADGKLKGVTLTGESSKIVAPSQLDIPAILREVEEMTSCDKVDVAEGTRRIYEIIEEEIEEILINAELSRAKTSFPQTEILLRYLVTGKNRPKDTRIRIDTNGYATEMYSLDGKKVTNYVNQMLRDTEVIREATMFGESSRGVIYWMVDVRGHKRFPVVSFLLFENGSLRLFVCF